MYVLFEALKVFLVASVALMLSGVNMGSAVFENTVDRSLEAVCLTDISDEEELTASATYIKEETASEETEEETAEPVIEEEPVQSEPSPYTYLGEWTATAYCNCEVCCGQWAGGCTASGVYPTSCHTVACNSLPLGTQLLIDGIVYVVEDTGWSPYGDAWVDIYFDSHEEALCYGLRTVSVYLVN